MFYKWQRVVLEQVWEHVLSRHGHVCDKGSLNRRVAALNM
jgi:hypothetical protein